MARGDRRALACDAFDTRGHYVSRATCRLSVESGLEARGDTLIAGAPDSLYLVRATWLRSDGGRPSDSVWVRVIETPSLPPVVVPPPPDTTPELGYQLVASPIDTTLAVGASLQYTVQEVFDSGRTPYTYPSSGSPVLRFSVTNPAVARVDQTGLVTALAAGTTGVLIEKTKRGLSFMATLLVTGVAPQPPPPPPIDTTSPPPPPPPPPPGVASCDNTKCPNEPAGYVGFNMRQFQTRHPFYGFGSHPQYPPNPAVDIKFSEGWTSTEGNRPGFTVQPDLTASDGMVGQMLYPAGMRSGVGPAYASYYYPQGIEVNRMPAGYRRPVIKEVYIAIRMKLSKNWIGNQASINKMMFHGIAGGNNQGIFIAYGKWTGPLRASYFIQGVQDTSGDLENRRSSLLIKRGQWQTIEIILKCNSAPGAYDGTIQLFVDGVRGVNQHTINWTKKSEPNRACTQEQLTWNPTFGGGGEGVPYNHQDVVINNVLTRSRQWHLNNSGTPVSEFAIDLNDEAQYQWVDWIYSSGR